MQNLTEEEVNRLEACKSEEEWDAACDAVKKARGGSYPPNWFAMVLQSGLARRTLARFGATDELKISTIAIPK